MCIPVTILTAAPQAMYLLMSILFFTLRLHSAHGLPSGFVHSVKKKKMEDKAINPCWKITLYVMGDEYAYVQQFSSISLN